MQLVQRALQQMRQQRVLQLVRVQQQEQLRLCYRKRPKQLLR